MKKLGHLNDTIVVNQPRLSLDDNDIVTVNEKGEMQMVAEDGQKINITESSNLESSDGNTEFIVDGNECTSVIIDNVSAYNTSRQNQTLFFITKDLSM